ISFPEPSDLKLKGQHNMAFISTYTPDEPLEVFLDSARRVPDVQFYVTGRIKDGDPDLLRNAPANVTFTDFLSTSDYAGLLSGCDAVICLTTADHTMQRGAYEAVYLGKPVITSNFNILRSAFAVGAVHVSNTVEDVAKGVIEMKSNLAKYQR